MRIPLDVIKNHKIVRMNALLDSGATHCFVSPKTVIRNRWATTRLSTPIKVSNADGSHNKDGEITAATHLFFEIAGKVMHMDFYVTNIGEEDLMLGMTWLKQYDPAISWNNGTLKFRTGHIAQANTTAEQPRSQKISPEWVMEQDLNVWTRTLEINNEVHDLHAAIDEGNDVIWIRAKFTPAQQAAEKAHQTDTKKTLEEMIPADLLGF